jgi:hypothetical protein
MLLIILGFIIFIAVNVVAKTNPVAAKFTGAGRILGLVFVLVGISSACVKQIDANRCKDFVW